MVPQSRACSIELVVEPIELRGQMREVVILKVEDNGTDIPRGAREACGGGSRNVSLTPDGCDFGGNQCAGLIMPNRPWIK
jgi:hypothetical protein